MNNTSINIARLIELSLAAELAAENLYRRFSALFIEQAEVHSFWLQLAKEEKGHARWLQSIREKLSEEVLSEPVKHNITEAALQTTALIAQAQFRPIHTLEDAFQIGHELEASEINVIFEFLFNQFINDQSKKDHLREQLHAHIEIFQNPPAPLNDRLQRQFIKAKIN